MKARFPKPCVICGEMFVPQQDEIAIHPSLVGPKGGKQYAHVSCMSRRNPRGVRISERQYEGTSADLREAAAEHGMGFSGELRGRRRGHGVPELVHISVMKAPKGSREWRVTYDAHVPFQGAGVALQRIINQNSEALPAREVQSVAQQALEDLVEEGGSTSFELQRRGQSVLVAIAREDRTLAERGYVIPSVERRAEQARRAQDRAAFSRRVDRYHQQGLTFEQGSQPGGAYGPQAEFDAMTGNIRPQRTVMRRRGSKS